MALDFNTTLDVFRRQFLNKVPHRAMWPRAIFWIARRMRKQLADVLLRDINAIDVLRESAHLPNPAVKRVVVDSIPPTTRNDS